MPSAAKRVARGSASLSISSRFGFNSMPVYVRPVMFPPGRARLLTNPNRIGSVIARNTIGIDVVAFFAANAP